MNPYFRLDSRIQRWIYQQGWPDLRVIQQRAVEPVLSGACDVLISASTAAGKTEAAFLPAMTAMADNTEGFSILYVSPLKALINDQYRRLEGLCEMMDMSVTRWHGDANQSGKQRVRKNPTGILLITPESLEAMMINHNGWCQKAFPKLGYVIIDEFHAFIGTERGQHLLSLLTRLEHLSGRLSNPIPRIALSATLGDLDAVPLSLRPSQSMPCQVVTSNSAGSTIALQVRGYRTGDLKDNQKDQPDTRGSIVNDLYALCRGGTHLVFANSRSFTEDLSSALADRCEDQRVPNEFFPHHGSLSKHLREDLEARLQKGDLPTTAVCTMTLELGIDIGKVDSVFQVRAPHSVSSLRQRLGRSGRRGMSAILRLFIPEREIDSRSSINDRLRLGLIQTLAIVRLLIGEKWFEPADTNQLHFSTLAHQVMATVAQWGSIQPGQLHSLLLKHGPFGNVSLDQFKSLLSALGSSEHIAQLPSGELVIGAEGEKLVNHYSFYPVFQTPIEYRITHKGKDIGAIPVDSMLIAGQMIIFAGKRWKVAEIDVEQKTIRVVRSRTGKAPLFGGSAMCIHDRVRAEMRDIYITGDYRINVNGTKQDFIDAGAQALFEEGATGFNDLSLDRRFLVTEGTSCSLFTWRGDKVVNTLAALLTLKGVKASNEAGIINIEGASSSQVTAVLEGFLREGLPTGSELALSVPEKRVEKFDDLLPDDLLSEGFARRVYDLPGALEWIEAHFSLQPLSLEKN